MKCADLSPINGWPFWVDGYPFSIDDRKILCTIVYQSLTPGVKSSGAFWGNFVVPASPVSLKMIHSENV